MKIDIMPVWYFLIKYSRKSRLKILLSVLGLVVLGIVLGIILALWGVDLGAEIVIQCALLGIISIPFLLLALIPKQRVEKSGGMSAVNRIVSSVKEEYKKTQSRPATTKERYLLGGILLFVTLICFWMGSFAILGGIFFSIMSFCCFCSRIPVQIQSRKKGCSRTFKMEDDEGKKKSKIALIGIMFIMVGFFTTGFATAQKITCSKIVGECEIQAQHLWEQNYKTESRLSLNDLSGAFVESETSHGDHGDTITYYVVLHTNFGNQRLFDSSSSFRSTHEAQANEINQFLNSDQETLEIEESKFWLFFPLIFVVIGGFLLWYDLTFLLKKSKVKSSTLEKGKK